MGGSCTRWLWWVAYCLGDGGRVPGAGPTKNMVVVAVAVAVAGGGWQVTAKVVAVATAVTKCDGVRRVMAAMMANYRWCVGMWWREEWMCGGRWPKVAASGGGWRLAVSIGWS